MFDDFTFNRGLKIGGSSGTREIDSLERVSVTVEFSSVHEDDGCLSCTSSSNQKSMLETMLTTFVVSFKGKSRDLINDVLSTSGVTCGDKELGEHNLLGSVPAIGLPERPFFGLGVKEVIENSFLLIE
jgi:hypothetical protein